MRRKIPLVFGCVLLIVFLIGNNALPARTVQATNILQGMPRLDGAQIYFSEAFGEASRFDRSGEGLSRLAGLLEMLGANLYTLEWRTGIPSDADLVVLAGPLTDLGADETAWLWAYLQNGGKMLLITDPVVGSVRALPGDKGLLALMWRDMGLGAHNDVAVLEGDPHMAVPPGIPARGNDPTPTPMPAVEVPSLSAEFFATVINDSHPILDGIDGELAFFTARTLQVDSTPRDATVTTLISTTEDYYGETLYSVYLDSGYVEYNIGTDTTRSALPLAASYQHAKTGARIVLIGDREFAINRAGLQSSPPYSPSFLYPNNVKFLVNAVAWLLDVAPVAGELSFPTPGSTATPTITPSPTPMPTPTEAAGS